MDNYKTIFLVTDRFEIIIFLLYLKKHIYKYNNYKACT